MTMSWDIDGKRVLVTGGNSGIGKATAEELARRGGRVMLTARDERRGDEAAADIRRVTGAEVDVGRGPSLQPSCMIECAPDMVVATESEVTKKAQDGVLEFLLINHPLDCPVCDKGGECPLQDQTMAYGPGESRFVEEKRHFEKPLAISRDRARARAP